MLANLLGDSALAHVQAQQEHPKDVSKVIDELGVACEEVLNPESGDLFVGAGGVQAL